VQSALNVQADTDPLAELRLALAPMSPANTAAKKQAKSAASKPSSSSSSSSSTSPSTYLGALL
jgi:hypothetical protein